MSDETNSVTAEAAKTAAEEKSLGETPAAKPAEKPVKRVRSTARKKKIRRLIIWLIVLALLGGGGWWAYQKFFKKEAPTKTALTDFVSIGSITSKVEGSGLTKARNSKTISVPYQGTILELLVEEGQQVYAGDLLYTVDSPAAQTAVDNARERIGRINKQIADIRKSQEGLNVAPAFSGKLLDTRKLNPGDIVSGGSIATIVDDTVMRLTQYYSYAYEGMIKKGQSMEVSIPALMTSVTGTVNEIRYVSRVTPEGSKLFAVELSVPNKGILTKGMKASASAVINGESVFPYEEGEFDYNREGTLDITIGGKVISANLYDYMDVKKGQVLVRISADDSNDQIREYSDQLKEAQENLDKALEDLDACRCVAPIDGTIIGLAKTVGDEVNANEQILTISDRTTLIISTNVDERNIGFVKVGMPVSLDQWGKPAFGYVESVSLQSTVNNGVATYPVTIAADNMEDQLQLNSYINYTIEASRSDNCLIIPIQCVYNAMLADESEAAIVYVRNYEGENGVTLMDGSGTEVPEDFTPVAVTTGISDSYNVEITSGLEEGMEVFTQMVSTEVWN